LSKGVGFRCGYNLWEKKIMSVSHSIDRQLRWVKRFPHTAIVSLVTLALGIGANTAAFRILYAVAIQPLRVKDSGQLVLFSDAYSYPRFVQHKDQKDIFHDVVAFRKFPFKIGFAHTSATVEGETVSSNYFDVLGVQLIGHSFQQVQPTDRVAIISERIWKRMDPKGGPFSSISFKVNGEPVTVIGIAPNSFRGMDWRHTVTDVWIPVSIMEDVMHFRSDPNWNNLLYREDARWLMLAGRLKTTLEQAQPAVRDAWSVRSGESGASPNTPIRLTPVNAIELPAGSMAQYLTILCSVSIIILILVCANLSNLFLAVLSSRESELALRLALGATRRSLVFELLSENVLLFGAAVISGLGICAAVKELLETQLPMQIAFSYPGLTFYLYLFAVAIVVSLLVTAGVVGWVGRKALPENPAAALLGTTVISPRRHTWGARKGITIVQIAISTFLLISTTLTVKSLLKLQGIDPGFSADNIYVVSVDLTSRKAGFDEATGNRLYNGILEQTRSIPGILSVAWGRDEPLTPIFTAQPMLTEDQLHSGITKWTFTECNVVSPGYMKLMGISIVQGRDFDERDSNSDTSPAVIINETMARAYWPGMSPIGRRIALRPNKDRLYEIVGVARDVKYRTLTAAPKPYFFVPQGQLYYAGNGLYLKVAGNPAAVLERVQQIIAGIDPDIQLSHHSLKEQLASASAPQRASARTFAVSTLIAILLAIFGIYGLLAFSIKQREREVGIRLSLGAMPGRP
jgi:predicted permease